MMPSKAPVSQTMQLKEIRSVSEKLVSPRVSVPRVMNFRAAVNERVRLNGSPPPVRSPRPTTARSKTCNTHRYRDPNHSLSLSNFGRVLKGKGVLSTPRSLRVCEQEGINPHELVHRTLLDFMGPNVPESVAQLRSTYYEKRRIAKLDRLRHAYLLMQEEAGEDANYLPSSGQRRNSPESRDIRRREHSMGGYTVSSGLLSNGRGSCGSALRYRAETGKSYNSSRRPTLYGSECCFSSQAIMRISSRIQRENRRLTEVEQMIIKRIEEREWRVNAARQRASESSAVREKELILKELQRERKDVNRLIEREVKKNTFIVMQRQKRDLMFRRARDRREEQERLRLARLGVISPSSRLSQN
ncbi:hypothetical protein TRVL_00943 [Trypanosoma vivax]|nr:hypothetical protein TRVL_00943 [Trypanosoma vivax]